MKKRMIATVSLTDWELGSWPEELMNAISFEKSYGEIRIVIEDKLFEMITRKIITEAINTYLEDACFELTEGGLQVQERNEYCVECEIPWDQIHLKTPETIEKIKAWAKEYTHNHFGD